ncbi:hypothetical protein [Geodermatophilus sp. SYSU D01036]
MPEPADTIRRVNSDEPMTRTELLAARYILEGHKTRGKVDVDQARRRVDRLLSEQGVEPLGGATAASDTPKKQEGNPVLGFIVLLIIVAIVVYACNRDDSDTSSGGDDSGSSSETDDRSDGMAKVMCEDFIEERLKAPSTADFSGIFDTTITGSGDDYTVRGYVDAENSFGAMLRSNYTCQIHDNGDDTWSLVSLTGLD